MIRVCIIGVWFGGPLPPWTELWARSAGMNPTIDFLVVTDREMPAMLPENMRVLPSSLPAFKALAQEKLGMKIRLEEGYKLNDYKCVFGRILEEEIRSYDYWGACDFDMLFGDLRSFLEKYRLQEYDKFLCRGHLTLYRNSREVIDRYRLRGGAFGNYREIFRSDLNWGFDEMYGMNRIYLRHGFPYFDRYIFADIDRRYRDLRLSASYLGHQGNENHVPQVFSWKNGKVYQEWISRETGEAESKEFIYIHFAKRRFGKPPEEILRADAFCVTPEGFVLPPETMSAGWMEHHNPYDAENVPVVKDRTSRFDKKMKFFWAGRRYLNLKCRFRRLVSG